LEFYQIRHFAAVVETGSFTKAAIRAAVSQPALSVSIAKLEEELGVRRSHRSPKSATLTRRVVDFMRPRRRFCGLATK
jgi:DNA-binding transcriptional LysR family regulator